MDKYILLDANSLAYAFQAATKGSNDVSGLRAISEYASQNGFKFVVTDVVLEEIRRGPQQAEILYWLASNAEPAMVFAHRPLYDTPVTPQGSSVEVV